ncbi:hypothetical protein QLQ15_03835 [Lysobacter sp. LF1]|uniref:DUF4175 domain-containing protein n=1 Tax=Lysobacter stagni TaxID=3045172 RepID=A0ABT6XD93_9GAMM|nr:hypothetical protein [Lysobacter sp. LF1]MDI9238036.1 hypothetical protein [Lysobacter sp. LF1]
MWSRAFAGIVPGFLLSAGLVGLFTWALPGPWQGTIVPGIIAFFVVWIAVMAASFQFANGKRAWAWLCGLAVLSLGALWLLQWLRWIE